eukprot:scaffold148547_cov47-Cyclotella_meneghiniana.AAC.2
MMFPISHQSRSIPNFMHYPQRVARRTITDLFHITRTTTCAQTGLCCYVAITTCTTVCALIKEQLTDFYSAPIEYLEPDAYCIDHKMTP